ncbi:hypothetical protein M2152_000533 [Microbacteriaceae bacterium SG_E_30_P1]|uniref:Uncharacterized protein n=1 Tax=Antiquaquibacter oligotrophicus TaxID=2880260 RepID=A0ABT6KK46_9MICO|nr:hypothetical protein [Antiquaquibacter oligotrophicus]MDH6180351.1 hypothetical protein [Antiquaquibacter oligotrophicus]UDF13907.1 hypothetical protein LH407_03350 [Antiquaquibacter oligotrophicus]
MPNRRYLLTSAQQADPLSWFTGPYLPLTFAGGIFVFGTIVTLLTWDASPNPWLQLAALWLCVVAGLLVHVRSRPFTPPIGWGTSTLALATAIAGLALSAFDYRDVDFNFGLWWGPAGPAFILIGLSPYVSTRRLIVLGIGTTVAVVTIAVGLLQPAQLAEAPITTALVFAYPPAMAAVGSALFSYSIVSTATATLENPDRALRVRDASHDDAVAELENKTLARLTARATPFLLDLAEQGKVTPEDRALAGQLARRLRDDLVTQANETWLDRAGQDLGVLVVDPDRLARRMSNAQRTALMALLRAILELPEADAGALMVELRAADDGATAVAMSMDLDLPEGRRIMHLAPYYLTLGTAVDDLEFDRDRLTFSFGSESQTR